MAHKPYSEMTLEELRGLIKEVREEGLKIQRHYKRLEQEYSDWEDRVNSIENIIHQAERDTGLTKQEIYTPGNIFDDLLEENETIT